MTSDAAITRPEPRRHALGIAGRAITVDGVALSIADTGGSSLPIVCLHAAGHGSADYADMVALLPEQRIVTIDWPGQGRSGYDGERASVSRYVELLRGVLSQLRIRRVILVGNSVGGAAALAFTAQHPERVAGLVLANAGGLARPTAAVRLFTRAKAWMYRRGAKDARWFAWFFAAMYRRLLPLPKTHAHRRAIVAAGYENAAVLAELWSCFGSADNDLRHLIPSINCPVWLAWARSDPFNHHRFLRAALSAFDAELTLFDGGHVPFLEQPESFVRNLRRFLGAVDEAHVCGPRETSFA